MKKVIFLGQWWSVGESLFLVNLILNYCDYIKNNYNNKIYIIYHLVNEEFIYKNVLNIEHIKKYVDELHFSNKSLFNYQLKNEGYIEIFEWVYVHKDDLDFFNEVFKYNTTCWTKYEIFDQVFSPFHPTNTIRHEVEILNKDYDFSRKKRNSKYPKPLVKLSKLLKKISKDFRKLNNLYDYDVIHFRWNNRYDHHCGPEVVDYIVGRMEEVLDKDKKYFISTNFSLLIEKLKLKFNNIIFIDRADADFKVIESRKTTNKSLPSFIDEKILVMNPTMTQISNFIAHVELEIINNSNRVIHCSEISRDMISLFLWIPILINGVEILWVACDNNVIRKYNFNGCTYQNVLERPKLNKPECINLISGGKCFNR
jgi:hypothetical protein